MAHAPRDIVYARINRAMILLGLACVLLSASTAAEWPGLFAGRLNLVASGLFFLWLLAVAAWLLFLLASSPERRQPCPPWRQMGHHGEAANPTLWRDPAPDSRWLNLCPSEQSRAGRIATAAGICLSP